MASWLIYIIYQCTNLLKPGKKLLKTLFDIKIMHHIYRNNDYSGYHVYTEEEWGGGDILLGKNV